MKYAVEFKHGNLWIKWLKRYDTKVEAWTAIHERRLYADHIERRVVEVQS